MFDWWITTLRLEDRWQGYTQGGLFTSQSIYEKLCRVFTPELTQALMMDLSEVHSVEVNIVGTDYVIQWDHYGDKFTIEPKTKLNSAYYELNV